jgi:hypothetical protein
MISTLRRQGVVVQRRSTLFFLQQRLGIRMHAAQLLCDQVQRAVLLLRQPLDPPDLGKKLADLLRYVLLDFARSWSHQLCH